jgi:hypothetical protein
VSYEYLGCGSDYVGCVSAISFYFITQGGSQPVAIAHHFAGTGDDGASSAQRNQMTGVRAGALCSVSNACNASSHKFLYVDA